MISEKTKASILAANINENAIKKMQAIPASQMREERNIRFKIAQLNLSSSEVRDSLELRVIAREKAYFEMKLSRLLKDYEKNSDYYRLKYHENWKGLKQLQENISGDQAVISFYVVDSLLHAFVITHSGFDHLAIPDFKNVERKLMDLIQQLRSVETGKRYKGTTIATELYNMLVKPLGSMITDKTEWIIVPDGVLYYLPFEALQSSPEAGYLLESHAISYQFSTNFLQSESNRKSPPADYKVLSFAPFDKKGIFAKAENEIVMEELPASANEIAGLPGKEYYGSNATKDAFYREANHYPVLHLATHAVANNTNPSRSFIAFYPEKGSEQDFLYLDELYGFSLDSTLLVIMSACETGDGQLINNEGIMSLSRGFMYAGCASMVTSLWKANDGATAAITTNFHHYLREGLKKSKALQKAKLDYINSNTLYKSPNYWAHLVLIGDTCVLVDDHFELKLFLISAGLLIFVLTWPVIKKRDSRERLLNLLIQQWKEKRKKVDAFIGYRI
jgi:CHAT domain-containing protein